MTIINQLWIKLQLIENKINTQDRVMQGLSGLCAEKQPIQGTVKETRLWDRSLGKFNEELTE